MDTLRVTAPPGSSPSSSPGSSPPQPLSPAVAPSVQLSFTVLYTLLYGALFLLAYVQLWLLLVHRHKRWSFQSCFLFLCLVWAALRTTLFSFYFRNAVQANHLHVALYWLLYCFPVCLQFFTFSLINLYFTQVLVKAREMCHLDVQRAHVLGRGLFVLLSLLFLSVNVVCATLEDRDGSSSQTWSLVLVRVLVNDGLFILNAVLQSFVLMLLTRRSHCTSPYLLSKGSSVCRTGALGAAVVLLFTSRACYNLSALTLRSSRVEDFDFDWYNVSDQADLQRELGDRGFLVFGAVLFFWELLPMSLLMLIFRIRRPPQERAVVMDTSPLPRPYFFDDPQGDDDEAPVPWARTDSQPSLQNSWIGSETTPLLFAAHRPDQNQHHSLYSTPQNT
ncbi:integral membrane protein GPR137 [Eucyclogobius newberryi]|uniref:integral membrane protein GPR137 n=1 Tax=Eucyclogobius newberryi TaxID=166745 RepID=UPI003B5B374E